jgi:DNA polymerase-3 subunit delta
VQLRIWRGNRLERLVARLIAMHQSLLANSQDADLLLAEGLVEIARISTFDGKQRIKRTA